MIDNLSTYLDLGPLADIGLRCLGISLGVLALLLLGAWFARRMD